MTPLRSLAKSSFGVLLLSSLSFGQSSDFQTELKMGTEACERSAYSEAVGYFEQAVSLDPTSAAGHLRLGEAYNALYCETCEFDRGAVGDTNDQWRRSAQAEYQKVLELDPSNTDTLNSLAHVHYQRAEYDDAARFYRKAIEIDPANAEALYTLAVIDWQLSHRTRVEKLVELKASPQKTIIGSTACRAIRAIDLPRIEEGLELLGRALLVVNAAHVMEYTALLYRERAEAQCDNRAARANDLRMSNLWMNRACQARRESQAGELPIRWPSAPPHAPGGHCGSEAND